MTNEQRRKLLRETGEALYGAQWQTPLAADVGVNDRTMRRWIAGEFEIPEGVMSDLAPILTARAKTIAGILARLLA